MSDANHLFNRNCEDAKAILAESDVWNVTAYFDAQTVLGREGINQLADQELDRRGYALL